MPLRPKKKSLSPPKPVSLTPLTDIEEYPIPVYQFSIDVGGDIVALFQKISGMSVSRGTESVAVGGENYFGREFPGQISFGHIKFEGGLSSSTFFWDWMMAGQFEGRAQSLAFALIQRRPNPKGDVPVEVKLWNFVNAFPVSWKIADLNIDNSKNIVIETLELSFDYFYLDVDAASDADDPTKILENM